MAQLRYLIVSGGASGASNSFAASGITNGSGGGAAGGGVLEGFLDIGVGTYPMLIGQGGAPVFKGANASGNPGTASSAFGLSPNPGGAGGGLNTAGGDGGSGGGGGSSFASNGNTAGGNGTAGQGFPGGSGWASAGGAALTDRSGGGGGGGGGPGANAAAGLPGAGGPGFISDITGVPLPYGAGGAGAQNGSGVGALGGSGIGGNSINGQRDAVADTGSGGAGLGDSNSDDWSGRGANGPIIVSYVTGTLTATGGIVTTYSKEGVSYTVHKVLADQNFVVTAEGPPPPSGETIRRAGTSAGTASASAAARRVIRRLAASTGLATVLGQTRSNSILRAGAASGQSTVSGVSRSRIRRFGSSFGSSAAQGQVQGASRASGVAQGTSSVDGQAIQTRRVDGSADGTSTALGDAILPDLSKQAGLAEGRATVEGISRVTQRQINTLPAANNYEVNQFRADLPDSIQGVSRELFSFLRETTHSLREFQSNTLYGAERLPQSQLTRRYIEQLYPLGSQSAVQLESGHTAFVEFVKFDRLRDPENPGRLVYRSPDQVAKATGEPFNFLGIDFTHSGAGEYGWVITGGYSPVNLAFYDGPQPALVGAVDGLFSALPRLKHGVIESDMIHLRTPFLVDEEIDGVDLAGVVVEITKTQTDLAELRAELESIAGVFGRFESRSLTALSRLESKAQDNELSTVYADFLEQSAGVIAIGNQIAADREFLNQRTGDVIGFANAAANSSARAQTFSLDSQFWAEASEQRSLSAASHSDRAQVNAAITESFSVSAGESAASAEAALAVFAAIGVPSLAENSGFDVWTNPAATPENWTRSAGSQADVSRVSGFSSPFAIRLSTSTNRLTQIRQLVSDQTNDLFAGLSPAWYVIETDVRLVEGQFNESAFGIFKYESGGSYLGPETFRVRDEESGGSVIGNGVPGRVYRIRKLIHIDEANFGQLGVFIQTGDSASQPPSTYRVDWERVDVRIATNAEISTETVLESAVAQIAAVQTQVNSLVTADSAQAASISLLNSEFNTLDSAVAGLLTTTAGHTTQLGTLSTAQGAQATSITNLSAQLTTTQNGLTAANTTIASHTTQINAVTTSNNAQATQITSLTSQVNGVQSSVTSQASTIVDLLGRTEARFEIVATSGGRASLEIFADSNNGGGVNIVGDVQISGNLLVSGSVNTAQLANDSVTVDKINVNELSAITANIGLLRSATSGQRFELTSTGFRLYYANGTLAARFEII